MMNSLPWIVRILSAAFLVSSKTTSSATKPPIKRQACMDGQLTLNCEDADRNVNAVQDVEWKIKLLGTGWIKFSSCSYKSGVINCFAHRAILADGITLLNNSNGAVTIERSGNATHDRARIMCQVHYYDHSTPPSRCVYEVNFTAQCVRLQEGRDLNLTKILLMNFLHDECERVVDIEWYSINESRFAYCGSCQVCTKTRDGNHSVPDFWNRLQVRRGSLLLTRIQDNDNRRKFRVKVHTKPPKGSAKRYIGTKMETVQVYRIWIFVDSSSDFPAPNTATTTLTRATAFALSISRPDTERPISNLHSPEPSYPGDVVSTPFTTAKLHSGSHSSASITRGQLWPAVAIAETVLYLIKLR
ncbi:hypothetical protein ACROYT_G005849 [Oculina patagonica]